MLTVIFFITCASTVSAEETDWTDENYNFSNIQRVYLCKVDTSSFKNLDASTSEKIQNVCKNFAGKLKRIVFVDDEKSADVKIILMINVWEVSSCYVPERLKVYHEGREERRVKVRDGKWKWERGNYKTSYTYFPGARRKEERIPAHYEYYSVLEVSFEVYDVKSEKLVISRKDERKRGGKNRHLSMFERSCKAFFKELNKRLKR